MILSSDMFNRENNDVEDKNNNASLAWVDGIYEILNGNIMDYSRKSVENMLKNPETMVLDGKGRLCIVYVYNAARIMQKELWMIFATPVAMAVFLKKYTYVKRLLRSGYKYDIMAHFEAYNIEGNIGEQYNSSDMARLVSASDNICRFNDITNFQLMTCMTDVPEWVNDGIFSELKTLHNDNIVIDSVIADMKLYYTYSDALACEPLNDDNSTAVCSKSWKNIHRPGADEYYRKCNQRYNDQLKSLTKEISGGR